MQEIDWSEVVKAAGDADKPPKAGPQMLTCETCEWKESAKGKPMLKMRHRITGGPDDGKAVFDNLTLSPESPTAMSIFVNSIKAFGLNRRPSPPCLTRRFPSSSRVASSRLRSPPTGCGTTSPRST